MFDIVFFTSAYKESSMLNFLGTLGKAELVGILDRHNFSYLQAKPIKDISKLGGGYVKKNILVLDEKIHSKYYPQCKYPLMLVEGNRVEARIHKKNGKVTKMSEQ